MKNVVKKAEEFITQYYSENSLEGFEERMTSITKEIEKTGSYTHTKAELIYGAKVAWRNSNRCIGRLFWRSLKISDQRGLTTEKEMIDELFNHIKTATNQGKVKSIITIFRQADPKNGAIRIWNKQLIQYAGYVKEDGEVIGDAGTVEFTKKCMELGWKGNNTRFDVLPLVLQLGDNQPKYYDIPKELVLEVAIEHPKFEWLKSIRLKWYAVPFISNMVLEIGGILYTAAPFNGWYMGTEIASRNLGDKKRYNMLPAIAQMMELDTNHSETLWKDSALVALNQAVLFSFKKNGVSMVDHHKASEQFMDFVYSEELKGRAVKADWIWIVPPLSSSATEIFHINWDNQVLNPNFFYNLPAWKKPSQEMIMEAQKCPFHIN